MEFKKEKQGLGVCSPLNACPMQYFALNGSFYAFGVGAYGGSRLFGAMGAEGKGKWSNDEQRVYIRFLQQNIEDMTCSELRKANKVFLKMSKLVKTRTPDQCRSHHQKILKYHHSLQHIILTYKRRFEQQDARKNCNPTAPDEELLHGFYDLKQTTNTLCITIQQSTIQHYQP